MPAEFDAMYDAATLARVERGSGSGARASGSSPRADARSMVAWRRGAVVGGLITGLTLGLREVFDPPPDDEVVEEIHTGAPPLDQRPAQFHMVEGAPPAASRIVLRPWLVDR